MGDGPVRRWRDQQRACKFRNLCDSTRKIKLIDEYGTCQYIKQQGRLGVTPHQRVLTALCQYIKQQGRLGVTPHQRVLTALEQRAVWYQNSRTYEELEDEQLLDEAIDETGTLLRASDRGEERSQVVVEEQLIKEIRGVLEYLLEVHGLPPGRKGDGVTWLIHENLNGLQSRMSKQSGKLEKAQQVIDNLQADIVCYNKHHQNLGHKANCNGF